MLFINNKNSLKSLVLGIVHHFETIYKLFQDIIAKYLFFTFVSNMLFNSILNGIKLVFIKTTLMLSFPIKIN